MRDHIASIRAITLEDLEKESGLNNIDHEDNNIDDGSSIIYKIKTNSDNNKDTNNNKQ